jgi:transglutaminase-like putative cysteine protease
MNAIARPAVERALELAVDHETQYAYAAPVSVAQHLAHLRPLADEHQALLAFDLEIDPAPPEFHERVDTFGNACQWFALAQPHETLRVLARSRVRVTPRFAALDPARSPAWETVRDRLRYVARAPFDPAVEFAQPSPYVPRLEALRAYGAGSFPASRPLAEAAVELMRRIHADFAYRADATEVDTPLAQALAQRSGVCQDFAHVMIGALRMLGLPARYVSGYLRTVSSEDGHALVGAQASHAWVQVYAPGTAGLPADGWLDLDPTNDLVPGTDHVRLSVGRDYGDVAPLRGVIRGGGRHSLTVAVHTTPLGPARTLQEHRP